MNRTCSFVHRRFSPTHATRLTPPLIQSAVGEKDRCDIPRSFGRCNLSRRRSLLPASEFHTEAICGGPLASTASRSLPPVQHCDLTAYEGNDHQVVCVRFGNAGNSEPCIPRQSQGSGSSIIGDYSIDSPTGFRSAHRMCPSAHVVRMTVRGTPTSSDN